MFVYARVTLAVPKVEVIAGQYNINYLHCTLRHCPLSCKTEALRCSPSPEWCSESPSFRPVRKPWACSPTCMQVLIPSYPREEQTLFSLLSEAVPPARLLLILSLASPPLSLVLPHRNLFPQWPRDSLSFWSFLDSELDNLSASLHSPWPTGGKRCLLLPSLFASSSDVVKEKQ